MKGILHDLGAVGFIIVIILLIATSFGAYELWWKSYAAPRSAAIDRKVFEESKSYNAGVAADLGKIYSEYLTANEANKQILKQTVIAKYSDYDADMIGNCRIKAFLIDMRGY